VKDHLPCGLPAARKAVIELGLIPEKRQEPDLEDTEQKGGILAPIQQMEYVGKQKKRGGIALTRGSQLPYQFQDYRSDCGALQIPADRGRLGKDVCGLDAQEVLMLAFMEVEPAVRERFEPCAEAPEGLAGVLGNALLHTPIEGEERDQLVSLAQVHAADDYGFGFGSHCAPELKDEALYTGKGKEKRRNQ
jgi:hypothetical protein